MVANPKISHVFNLDQLAYIRDSEITLVNLKYQCFEICPSQRYLW